MSQRLECTTVKALYKSVRPTYLFILSAMHRVTQKAIADIFKTFISACVICQIKFSKIDLLFVICYICFLLYAFAYLFFLFVPKSYKMMGASKRSGRSFWRELVTQRYTASPTACFGAYKPYHWRTAQGPHHSDVAFSFVGSRSANESSSSTPCWFSRRCTYCCRRISRMTVSC